MYIGSVRFFKHLILLTLAVFIAVPTVLAIFFYNTRRELQNESARVQEELTQELETVREELAAEKAGHPSLSAEAVKYQKLYPDFYAPEPFHAAGRENGTVYLTFDGGPSAGTARILEVLKQQNVKATFFVTGGLDEAGCQLLREIDEQGHTLGMYGCSRDYAAVYHSVESYLNDVYPVFTQIKEVTGKTPVVFRFPGGSINSYNTEIYQELTAEMIRRGFVPCDWNVSGGDAGVTAGSAEEIAFKVVESMREIERGFVLLHDTGRTAAADALPDMIEGLRKQGFCFSGLTPETKPVLFVYKE